MDTGLSSSAIFVIIANWNGEKLLRECLESFFMNTFCSNCHIVVVDDASVDGSVDMLKREFPKIKLIRNRKNLGFSKANNIGIRYAMARDAHYVLLLNNDIVITEKKWLATMVNVLESDKKIGIVGCKLLYPNGRLQHAGGIIEVRGFRHRGRLEKDVGQYDKVQFVDYVTGAAFLIKTEVISKIGLLDEGFSPLYFEEIDWCARARFHGYEVAYTPIPVFIHKTSSTTKTLAKTKTDFYGKRNWIRFFLLNFKYMDILKRILLWEPREIINYFINRNERFPITIRTDAPQKLIIAIKAWTANIRDLKEIMTKRRQRFTVRETHPFSKIDSSRALNSP